MAMESDDEQVPSLFHFMKELLDILADAGTLWSSIIRGHKQWIAE
jgi:hypothetical protein